MGLFSVTVKNADGTPAVGVPVCVEPVDFPNAQPTEVLTDVNGVAEVGDFEYITLRVKVNGTIEDDGFRMGRHENGFTVTLNKP